MARPPKSIESLKLHGGYRKDRHGEREATQVVVPSSLPAKPEGLTEDAEKHWDRIIEHIGSTGAVGDIDGEAMETAARYWSLWRKAITLCEADPTDKPARMNAVAFGQQWLKAAEKLGLTPVDRMRLRMAPKEEKKGVVSRKRA